jgi:UDP-glucose 4-epimerase
MRRGWSVVVVDNLSFGNLANLESWLKDERFEFVRGDLKNTGDAERAVRDVGVVFHLAANPEVRIGETDPRVHFEDNLLATFNLLEAMRRSRLARVLVLASTSTVYGEASVIPTPEGYGPLVPISLYGASKLGCEALACSFAYTFGVRALIVRLANVVGSRSRHGVIVDFIRKLRASPGRLEILGDGTQTKSYLHVDDCVEAFIHMTDGFVRSRGRTDVFNVGALDQISVKHIARVVVEQMKLRDVEFEFTGGVDGGRGWLGDVKMMHLSVDKLMDSGWRPRCNSEEAVRLATEALLREI